MKDEVPSSCDSSEVAFTPFSFLRNPGMGWLIERMEVWHVRAPHAPTGEPLFTLGDVYQCPGCTAWQVEIRCPAWEHENFWAAEKLTREHLLACPPGLMLVALTADL